MWSIHILKDLLIRYQSLRDVQSELLNGEYQLDKDRTIELCLFRYYIWSECVYGSEYVDFTFRVIPLLPLFQKNSHMFS